MKKVLSILILSCILLATACSGGPELLDFIDNGNSSNSLDGLTLYFKASLGPKDKTDTTGYLGYELNTVFADMAKERLDQVEKDLDVNIELSTECPEGFFNDIIYLLASGGGKLDANIGMDYGDFSMRELHTALTPMSHVSDHIDIYDSAKWGSPERLEMFAWDGDIYGVIPNYWPELQFASSDFILVPNIDYIKSLNQTDPREFFEEGIWTIEKLEELIPIYAQNGGSEEDRIYGYSANNRHFYELLVQYYGADWAQKNEDGVWELGAYSAEGRLAAQKCRDWQAGDLKDMIYFKSVGDQANLWADGKIAICTMHTVSLTHPGDTIPSSEYEYGVLPFPSQDGKSIFGQYERNVEAILIPSFNTRAEETAKVLSAIYEPFEGYEDTNALKETYNSNIFYDERDTEIVFQMINNLRVLPQNEEFSLINYSIADDLARNEVSAVLDKYVVKLQAVLEKDFVPVKETMEKLFPGYND